MNYFMSDVHGAATEYYAMKEKIGFKANDELYILGNIFDGNNADPEASLVILRDVMQNDNIHLVLGEHEYVHIMYYLTKDDPELSMLWAEQITNSSFQGRKLHKLLTTHLSEREYDKYMGYLLACPISDMLTIAGNTFYLVHGSPSMCNGDTDIWQYNVVTTPLEVGRDYSLEIASDPDIDAFSEKNGKIKLQNTFVIAGHTPTRYYFDDNPDFKSKVYGDSQSRVQKIICANRKFLLNCGCRGDAFGLIEEGWTNDLACLGIDAAGYFIVHLYEEEKDNTQ